MKVFSSILATVSLAVTLVAAKAEVGAAIDFAERTLARQWEYPTQFLQNIPPKMIHSHNDYWRDIPLLTALSYGAASVEADVWLLNGTLYVGHQLAALTPERTLDTLYIQPLLQILSKGRPPNAFTANSTSPPGVFDMASDMPLQLLIDVKTDGFEALPSILEALQPLREAGYLTTFSNGTLNVSVITVVGAGNAPLEQIEALSPRDLFFDAPLTQLTDRSLNTIWNATLSPLASANYSTAVGWNGTGTIGDAQMANITRFVGDAHARGIKARFFDIPAWPVYVRDNIWRVLLDGGVDWLNVDDVAAAAAF
ncbi:hypothetical protein GY45DRAFT_1323510 [Cubamyces sp. BRFM 1775]|nr:hypothetical protein GY45DRAFT_1323510 [Cubamyces sp. BRFM 1775]